MRQVYLYIIGFTVFTVAIVGSAPCEELSRGLVSPSFRVASPLAISTLDDETDTLIADNGNPYYVFRYPDVYGDDLRNQWFQMPYDALIAGVMIGLVTDAGQAYSTGDPDLELIIWESAGDSLPDAEAVLLRDTTIYEEYAASIYDLNDEWTDAAEQFVIVDLRDHDLRLSELAEFHVGYSAILNSEDDSLAIMADRAIPESYESSEWYNGEFHYMREAWRGVNFFIRVILEAPADAADPPDNGASITNHHLLRAYPNPFNAHTDISLELARAGYLSVNAFDILGRRVAALFEGNASQTRMTLSLNAESWSSGIYFVRVSSPTENSTLKIILQK